MLLWLPVGLPAGRAACEEAGHRSRAATKAGGTTLGGTASGLLAPAWSDAPLDRATVTSSPAPSARISAAFDHWQRAASPNYQLPLISQRAAWERLADRPPNGTVHPTAPHGGTRRDATITERLQFGVLPPRRPLLLDRPPLTHRQPAPPAHAQHRARSPDHFLASDARLSGASTWSMQIPASQLLPNHFFAYGFHSPWRSESSRGGSIAVGEQWTVSGETAETWGGAALDPMDPLERTWVTRHSFADPWEVARVGVHRELLPDRMSGYYAFEQTSRRNADDAPWSASALSPMVAAEYHRAGVQARSADGRWVIEASGFYTDTSLTDTVLSASAIDWRRGAELALHAGITSRWKATVRVSGSKSRLASVAEDAARTPGRPIRSNSSVTLWNRFHLLQAPKRSLEIGVGTKLVTERRNSYEDSMILGGYARWDLGVFYKNKKLESRLYIENFLNTGYYRDLDALMEDPDSPLSVEAQLRLTY